MDSIPSQLSRAEKFIQDNLPKSTTNSIEELQQKGILTYQKTGELFDILFQGMQFSNVRGGEVIIAYKHQKTPSFQSWDTNNITYIPYVDDFHYSSIENSQQFSYMVPQLIGIENVTVPTTEKLIKTHPLSWIMGVPEYLFASEFGENPRYADSLQELLTKISIKEHQEFLGSLEVVS